MKPPDILRFIYACGCLAALVLSPAAPAQQMYVDDKLVLNVYSEANQGGERLATIETGDQVEVLERVENSVRVRLADGREGWVGASYLTDDAPAAIRLKQLQDAAPEVDSETTELNKKLSDEVARLKKQNTQLQKEAEESKKAAAALAMSTPPPPAAPVASAPPEPQRPISREPPRDTMRWIWPFALLTGLALGFLLGYQMLARRIRRKYGRVNII